MIAPALRNREPAYVQYTRAIGALNQLFRRFAIRRPASTERHADQFLSALKCSEREFQTKPNIPANAPPANSHSGFHDLRRTTATVSKVIK